MKFINACKLLVIITLTVNITLINSTRLLKKLSKANEEDKVNFETLKREVFEETNKLRTNPKYYAKLLQDSLKYYYGNTLKMPGRVAIATHEGKQAVLEAINFLNKAKPLPALLYDDNIAKATQEHANDLSKHQDLGHQGSDGKYHGERISRYVQWRITATENIDFGAESGQNVVISLVVDDGVLDRGHRTNLFRDNLTHTGVGVNTHQYYRICTVINYTGGLGDVVAANKNISHTPNPNYMYSNSNSKTSTKNPFKDDKDAPEIAKSVSTSISTSTLGNNVTKTTTKTYTLYDDTTKVVTNVEKYTI